jgi:hypothetical protein
MILGIRQAVLYPIPRMYNGFLTEFYVRFIRGQHTFCQYIAEIRTGLIGPLYPKSTALRLQRIFPIERASSWNEAERSNTRSSSSNLGSVSFSSLICDTCLWWLMVNSVRLYWRRP